MTVLRKAFKQNGSMSTTGNAWATIYTFEEAGTLVHTKIRGAIAALASLSGATQGIYALAIEREGEDLPDLDSVGGEEVETLEDLLYSHIVNFGDETQVIQLNEDIKAMRKVRPGDKLVHSRHASANSSLLYAAVINIWQQV